MDHIDKAFMMIRVPPSRWMDEAGFADTLRLFDKHREAVDGLTLFTSFTHAPLRLDEIERRAETIKERIRAARAYGFCCGVNILATVGHHEENSRNYIKEKYIHATDIDGRISRGSYCPNDRSFLEGYVKKLYELIAKTKPDHIWIDDDVRFDNHLPLKAACFCDACIEIFSDETGIGFSRESLKKAFDRGSTRDRLDIRKQWIEHNRRSISRLFEFIEKTVHGMDEDIVLGFMTGERYFEGYDFDKWAEKLSGPGNREVIWRPGGGFYNDRRFDELTGKAHEIGRQVSLLGPGTVRIYSEIENFFYQKLKKSERIVVLEIASYIAAGCTGAALNIISENDDLQREHGGLLKNIAAHRPFFDRLSASFQRSGTYGIWAGWCRDSRASVNLNRGRWMAGRFYPTHTEEMNEIGLPQGYDRSMSCVSALSGSEPYSLEREAVTDMLSGGVYLDAGALESLNDLGFAEHTGFRVSGYLHADCAEKFTSHILNVNSAGIIRDCRQSFQKMPAAVLTGTQSGSESLASLVDYDGREKAGCCMGVYENSLGGRICIGGYFPWTYMHNLSKSEQIKRIMRWLSRDTLPAYTASLHKTALWIRRTSEGQWALLLLNCSHDAAEDVEIHINTTNSRIRLTGMDMSASVGDAAGNDGGYMIFCVPRLGPFDMAHIELL